MSSKRWELWYAPAMEKAEAISMATVTREMDERIAFDTAPFKVWVNGTDVSAHQNIEDAKAAAFKLDRELQGTMTVLGIIERLDDDTYSEWRDENFDDIEQIIAERND